ncbi:MAG TPA: methylated-DNA--[protein]-cysteine S-methyltransferase [Jatrophihabitantaceae bacterium]|nr:methylated-DNA--[protein]-cysteine S-methyltransferase [Jatrophihabitantaceae bacterium]
MTDTTRYTTIESPLGELLLVGDDVGLTDLYRQTTRRARSLDPAWARHDIHFAAARSQLEAYFAGELRDFDLRLNPRGSSLQLRVWAALRDIPYGETASYGAIANRIGWANGARAVGAINGQNPLPIIIPCHRVIGADGSLVGYGGGLPMKQFLLSLEASHSGLFATG